MDSAKQAKLQMTTPVDILHLTFRPPFTSGSFNRLVAQQVERLPEFRHGVISYWDQALPTGYQQPASLYLVNKGGLSLKERALLRLPDLAKKRWFNGFTGTAGMIYFWQIVRLLPQLRPKLIVCYENYQLGGLLRPHLNWPCRLVLNQQGLSYQLEPRFAATVYSLNSYDVIWTSTMACYEYDRQRMNAYEALVKVLPNWVDMENFKPVSTAEKLELRTRWNLPPAAPIVLWLSRLVPKKGAHAIIQAWPRVLSEIPDALLWIVGGGDAHYENYLRHLIQALGLENNVRLQGFVPPDTTATCYQVADVYVFPTLFNGEGFGLSLLEGMACELACVASDCEILRELYTPEVVRLVPHPNLENAFAEPLVNVLRDPQLRTQMGRAARAFALQHYQPEKVLPQLKEFYQTQIQIAGGA